jgi:2-haloacid dehalogenase
VAAPRALLFDVFGTLVDWRGGLLGACADVAGRTGVDADWPAVVDDWRRAYRPALDAVRAEGAWRDLDAVQRVTLTDVLAGHGVALPEDEREVLVRAWRRLPAWPDAPAGLDRLRGRSVLATLSNGHVALLVDLLRFAGLRMDTVLSAELAGSYKPDPVVYRRGVELLGLTPEEVGMVAAHPDDLEAAAAVGLWPLFVARPREWGPGTEVAPPSGLPGLVVAHDLDDLADQLDP